ncbi:hypothetical protein L8Q47_15070 [Enterobacter bugandensis]|uniref:hypothetical protein n=1 Tax=Enterobacter bugandensis TaxID=881260 RepID=UPI002005FC79|nr:hypothetical protein [Enterobacter bugandensis]MCK6946325.1 hypothetical protein [Enterobacter bugandensis]
MDKCKRVLGFIFGHKYSVAITKTAPVHEIKIQGSAEYCAKVIDLYRSQTYHGIYCKRCGKVIDA